MRIALDIHEVILSRSNELLYDAAKEFEILRAWAGPGDHKGPHQLICITSRPLQAIVPTLEGLKKGNIVFDEYHFLGGKHKYVVNADYLVDNSLKVAERWLKYNPPESFILFWSPETDGGLTKLSDVIRVVEKWT